MGPRKTLPPGRYLYKLVIDGRWEFDPGNQQREPDGYGGFNSVVEVEGAGEGSGPFNLMVTKAEAGEVRLRASGASARAEAQGLSAQGPRRGSTDGNPRQTSSR